MTLTVELRHGSCRNPALRIVGLRKEFKMYWRSSDMQVVNDIHRVRSSSREHHLSL
jgi:hypothetical protein